MKLGDGSSNRWVLILTVVMAETITQVISDIGSCLTMHRYQAMKFFRNKFEISRSRPLMNPINFSLRINQNNNIFY